MSPMTTTNATLTTQAVHCPECGSKGKKVKRITLESLLTPDAAIRIGEGQYRFCDAIDCDTVYFGDDGTTFAKRDLTVRVGVKESTSPPGRNRRRCGMERGDSRCTCTDWGRRLDRGSQEAAPLDQHPIAPRRTPRVGVPPC